MFLQDRQCDFRIVFVTIVESYTRRMGWQLPLSQTLNRVTKRYDPEARCNLPHLLIEGFRITLVWKQRILLRQYTVIDQYRQAAV